MIFRKDLVMNKKIICFIVILTLFLPLSVPGQVQAASDTELNIYALYLNAQEKGDSTLLESRGQYLLVDMGAASHAPVIARQLLSLGATHIDILFSHLHIDHTGGSTSDYLAGLKELSAQGITVDTLYLPGREYTPYSLTYSMRYAQFESFMSSQGSGRVVYLHVGNEFQFGDVQAKVIGPVGTSQILPQTYTSIASPDEQRVRYENNASLATIFTCGNTRFFTAGDCYDEEAANLVSQYGNELRCDIMKLNHHGIGGGNSVALLDAVRPSYSFIPSSGLEDRNENTGKWRFLTAMNRTVPYGVCYLVGTEKKTLIYQIRNDHITLYQGSTITPNNQVTGWQSFYGADGFNRNFDMYYFGSNDAPVTGVKKLGSHYYYFRSGGQMDYGTYDEFGDYSGWKNYDGKERYFRLSDDDRYAYMSYGISQVAGASYYFDRDGFKIVPDADNTKLLPTLVGSNYYSIDPDGEVTLNCWEEIDGSLYYFGSNGKMYMNCVKNIGGQYYLFEEDGVLVTGDKGTEFYDFKNNTYAVRKDGTLVTGKCAKLGGKKYYFSKTGIVQKDKVITIGKNKYYFNKHGQMVCSKRITIHGKKFSANKNGVLKLLKK